MYSYVLGEYTHSIAVLFMEIVGVLACFLWLNIMNSDFLGFGFNLHLSNHISVLLTMCCKLTTALCTVLLWLMRLVTSAYYKMYKSVFILLFLWLKLYISWQYRLYKNWDKGDPWGTPCWGVNVNICCLCMIITAFLLHR